MNDAAQAIIAQLRLQPHPEGGWYRETFRATLPGVGAAGQPRAASTAIYFLLPAGAFSALHRVRSDEVWHHYAGDPVDLHLIDGRGVHEVVRLGSDLAGGEQPQVIVPADVWQAAVPAGDLYALCGCTVAPGFDFADFEMPGRAALVALFPQHRALMERLTRG